MHFKYCQCLFRPTYRQRKYYTFATDMFDLQEGDTVCYEKNGVIHELVFVKFCRKPRGRFHIKLLMPIPEVIDEII